MSEQQPSKVGERELLSWVHERQAGVFDRPPIVLKKLDARTVVSLRRRIDERERFIKAIDISRHATQQIREMARFAGRAGLDDPHAVFNEFCGYSYLMLFKNGLYKIGKSDDVDDRQYQLESAVGEKAEQFERYLTVAPYSLETALHKYFAPFQVPHHDSREFFNLPHKHVAAFMDTAAKLEPAVLDQLAAGSALTIHTLGFRLELAGLTS